MLYKHNLLYIKPEMQITLNGNGAIFGYFKVPAKALPGPKAN